MSIQRYEEYYDAVNNHIGLNTTEEGNWVKYDDHLAALAEKHKEYMEFAEWFALNRELTWRDKKMIPCILDSREDGNYLLNQNESHKYWLDNVRGKK
jgi:hypothetical protein